MRRLLGVMAVLMAGAVPAGAVQAPVPLKSPFETVIKQPTGRNGYEEIVYAGQLLTAAPAWRRFAAETVPPLSRIREVLRDRQVVEALRLLRVGLQKPVASPREQLSFETTMPEFNDLRALGRLLAAYEEGCFADGRIADALATVRLGLRLGQVVQMDSLLGMATGELIGTSCTRPLGKHLEQLSARDVETLSQLCREWLRQPGPELRVLDADRRSALGTLEQLRGQKPSPAAADSPPDPDEDEASRRSRLLFAEVRQVLLSGPGAREAFFRETARQIEEYYQQMQAELRRPFWERHCSDLAEEGPLPVRFAATMVSNPSGLGEIATRGQARLRLLACHAAVLRYRWEHGEAPATLAGLNLGELAVDPFTGKELEYEPMGRRYRLASAGPGASGRPLSVTPD